MNDTKTNTALDNAMSGILSPEDKQEIQDASKNGVKMAYIAGKITGLNKEDVERKFAAKQAELEGKGYQVLNPVALVQSAVENLGVEEAVLFPNWKEYMRFLLCYVVNADDVFMLPCWSDSKGATIERNLAISIGIPVHYGS